MGKRNGSVKDDAQPSDADIVVDAVESSLALVQRMTDLGLLPLNDDTLSKLKRAKSIMDRA